MRISDWSSDVCSSDLLRSQNLSETARERLALMRDTNDGFGIAEKDLELRGGGELLGLKQSGDAAYRLATAEQLVRLLPVADQAARPFGERDGGRDGAATEGGHGRAAHRESVGRGGEGSGG